MPVFDGVIPARQVAACPAKRVCTVDTRFRCSSSSPPSDLSSACEQRTQSHCEDGAHGSALTHQVVQGCGILQSTACYSWWGEALVVCSTTTEAAQHSFQFKDE